MIALLIGFTDDILGWKLGLRQRDKIFLSFLIPIPLMVVNSGHSLMNIPFLGPIEFGLLYPLVIIPVAIIGTSNAFNMLAGYNGLEAGMGVIILSALGYMTLTSGTGWVTVIAICMIVSLLSFLFFNWYPAKVFPGDTLTYPVGASIGIIAILGNIEKFALCLFGLYFIEFLLKARGKFEEQSFSKVGKDGTLSHNGKWFTIPHIAISILGKLKIKAKEKAVVSTILLLQLALAGITILYYSCC